MKKVIGLFFSLTLLGGGIFLFNDAAVGKSLAEVLKSDPRNSGIIVRSHYKNYVQPSTLVIDIKSVSFKKSNADVFRVLLQFAAAVEESDFEYVELQSQGITKYILDGEYFQNLGKEYGVQNPIYTIRTFPENLQKPDGSRAFEKWTGGALGVLNAQLEDVSEFHQEWYMNDIIQE